jgi:tubulin beta
MQAGQCDNQMGAKFRQLVCDEHGIGGGGEYCGDNDAQLGHINVFTHGA